MTASINFTKDGIGGIEKGVTFYKKFTLKNEDDSLYNLTGTNAKMQIRQTHGKPVILELSNINSRITLGGTLGTIELNVSASTSSSLEEGKYIYDLLLTASGGTVTKLFEGVIHIYPSVTN